ncbi:hypothetical protein K2X33_10870 [bacterium]|nr:hypothetical protein [bacterium]
MRTFALLCLWTSAALAIPTPTAWEPTGAKDGIALFKKEVAGSAIIALRGQGRVEAPLWKVASILLDTKRAPEWVDSMGESRVLRRISLDSYIEYNLIKTPVILQDRDFVSHVKIDVDPAGKSFALIYSPADDKLNTWNHTRGEIRSGRFELSATADGATYVDAEVHCDPMGSVPKWVVNLFQEDWPQLTFTGLRAQAAKADIRTPDNFRDVLAPLLPR